MNNLSGNEIRSMFLRFFEERGHRVVRSSSLVPANDPTLLFTNAGMNQFKDVFLGLEQRDYARATSCQKCVRAGGKHNDLENVGFTNRHHTFFEMLGNFSFGDYFKKDAIAYAWELVTSPQWYAMPLDKLFFTVFGGAEIGKGTKLKPDQEAAKLWIETGAPKDRVFEIPGLKENFWQMGDTGPCGPCSEIFYDMGAAASDQGHTDCKFPCECGRYVEIWNLVFMQFNRDADGKLNPLPKPSVDTGMGLERTAAVLQGKISNFETDLLMPLIVKAGELCYYTYGSGNPNSDASLRIIADHSRATTFLIGDGVLPSNEGRGYVLRKIMRRAIRHARLLGNHRPFLAALIQEVCQRYEDAYPELQENRERIERAASTEEHRFGQTFDTAIRQFDNAAKVMKTNYIGELLDGLPAADPVTRDRYQFYLLPGNSEESKRQAAAEIVPGHVATVLERAKGSKPKLVGSEAFRLYDTFGLARDFIADLSRDAGLEVDWVGFEKAMEEQRAQSKASWKGAHKEAAKPVYTKLRDTYKTEPDFYFGTRTRDACVEAIITTEGQLVDALPPGVEGEVVLDRTTIYAESGGQVADRGAFYNDSESQKVADVRGAYYPVSGLIAHRVTANEELRVHDRVTVVADADRRVRDMRNHTATHLLHAALRNILGTHVKQAGSLVAPEHLRFDFSHFAQVDPSELAEIEQQVNAEIVKNLSLRTDIMNIDEALASGALAFFGDKYPEANVRVVTISDADNPHGFYSKELCGGTHVAHTGEIGIFKITAEQSTAAGVRRIDAISGDRGLAEYQRALTTLRSAASLLNTGEDEVLAAIERQLETTRQLEKQLEALKRKSAGSQAQDLLEGVRKVKDVSVVAAKVSGVDRENLRRMVDTLRQKLGSGVVVLASAEDGKVALITGVTKDLIPKLHAGKIVQEIAKQVGGSGGGRPDLAEAGGKDPSGIDKALSSVYSLIDKLL